MKEKLLEHTTKELKMAAWFDLLITAAGVIVILHLFAMSAIAAGMAVDTMPDLSGGIMGALAKDVSFHPAPTIIMAVGLIVIAIITWFGVKTLLKVKKQRMQAGEGLLKLYQDEALEQYNDGAALKSYESRYNLFALIFGSLGALSVVVTLVIFVNQLTNL